MLIVGTATVWNWDWFIPLIEPRVSAAIGRKVTLAHLHVHLGRRTKLVADDVQIADPTGFASTTPFAQVAQFGITVDVLNYVLHQQIDIPLIDLNGAKVEAIALPSGQDNYSLQMAAGGDSSPAPKIGRLTIETLRSRRCPTNVRTSRPISTSTASMWRGRWRRRIW